jgi:fibronectin-binding autotransporter adhesin
MTAHTLSRWLMSVVLAALALIAINLLVTTSPVQGRPAAALINCSGSIQACIDAANDGDTILIAAGTYTESLTLSRPISLTGVSSDTTILYAMAGQRILTATGTTISNAIVISGLTFIGGQANNGGAVLADAQMSIIAARFISNTALNRGGAVYANVALNLADSRFENNFATHEGGGLFAGSAVTLTNVEFISNTADGGGGIYAAAGPVNDVNGHFAENISLSYGGGLLVNGRLNMSGSVVLDNQITGINAGGGAGAVANDAELTAVRFENNDSAGPNGGGLGIYGGTVYLTNTQFISNVTTGGGGGVLAQVVIATGTQFINNVAYTGGALLGGTLILSNTSFLSNTADAAGGGVWAFDNSQLSYCRFENNRSLADIGGGLYASNTGALDIVNTYFVRNTATSGGGLAIARPTSGGLINTVFADNTAAAGGADILNTQPGLLTVLYTTIAGSTSNSQSAIAVLSGTIYVTNTIIASHTIGIDNAGGDVHEDYNLFFDNLDNTIGVANGSHSLIGDPWFANPLADDYHLQLDSAAIDHGVDAGIYVDLDGSPRPIGFGFDIGAYERLGGFRYVATTGDDTSNNCTNSSLPCATLQHAIDVANAGEQVFIASGLYTQSATLDKPVNVTGVSSDTTILRAVAGQRVLTVTGATISSSVVISGLTFTGGRADVGGGIYSDAPLIIMESLFINNETSLFGGAVRAIYVTLTNTGFISNSNSGTSSGGAIAASDVWLSGGFFERNTSRQSGGGAISAHSLWLNGTTFVSNMANAGGAIYVDQQARIFNSHFENNRAGDFTSDSGGGALYSIGSLAITNTRFFSNSTSANGGAVVAKGATAMDDVNFICNTASGSGGGLNANDALTITNSTFISNSADFEAGGLFAGQVATLTNVDFISNTATDGGGGAVLGGPSSVTGGHFINNYASAANSTGGGLGTDHDTVLSGTEFIGNSAGFAGGGLYASYTATLYNTRFEANRAITYAGGLFAERAQNISGSTFDDNAANKGGGAIVGDLSVMTSTKFVGNSGYGGGGGLIAGGNAITIANALFDGNPGGEIALNVNSRAGVLHTTIASPTVSSDVGISIDFGNDNATVGIQDTIIASYTVAIQNDYGQFNGTIVEGYNLFFNNITNTVGVITGGHSRVGDPKFVDPLNGNYHLRLGSAAIDRGVDAGVYTDLDSDPRPVGLGFDIGAYEYQSQVHYLWLPLIKKTN